MPRTAISCPALKDFSVLCTLGTQLCCALCCGKHLPYRHWWSGCVSRNLHAGCVNQPQLQLWATGSPLRSASATVLSSVRTKPELFFPLCPQSVTKQKCPDLIPSHGVLGLPAGAPASVWVIFQPISTQPCYFRSELPIISQAQMPRGLPKWRGSNAFGVTHWMNQARMRCTDS